MNPALLYLIMLFLLGGCLLLTLLFWRRFRTCQLASHSSEALLQLFEAAPMAIVNLDVDGKILHWNQRATEILGWSVDQAIGQNFAQLTLPAGQHAPFSELLLAGGAGQNARAELLALNQSGELFEISLVVGPLGRPGQRTSEVVATIDDIRERKRMELTLRNSEETYRNLVEAAPVAIFVHVEGYLVFLNPAAVALFGAASGEALVGVSIETLLHPEDRAHFRASLERSNHDPVMPNRFSLRIAPQSGNEREVDATILGVDYSGCSARLAICVDVTERNRAERDLRTQTEFIQTMLDTIPAPIFYKDAQGLYLGCNRAFETFFGHPRQEIIGKSVYDLAPPDLAEIYFQADRDLLQRGGTHEYETQVSSADGDRHDVLFSKAVFNNQEGRSAGLVGAMIDISARKQAEEALRRSETSHRQLSHEFLIIFNGIPDSLTVWSPDQRLLWANRSSSDYFHQDLTELTGTHCEQICPYESCPAGACEIQQCLATEEQDDRMRKTRDGRTWGVKTFPLRDADGTLIQIVRLASDLSERVKLREEATRTAHLVALGELAAGVAHEVNNPTGLILLDLPVLRDAFRDARPILDEHLSSFGDFPFCGLHYSRMRDQIPAMFDEVVDGAQRIKQIVEELKDFSRPTDPQQFDLLDLNEVVRKGTALAAGKLRQLTDHFTIDYAPDLPLIRGSFHRLVQVLINLVLNAGQALPDRSQSVTVTVTARPEVRRIAVIIRDTGVGIHPEHLQLITDPFFTTRRETGGTGLGLSVSSRIVQEHHGTLHFDSQPGVGTTVTIELPIAETGD